jgi:hypothetical protein
MGLFAETATVADDIVNAAADVGEDLRRRGGAATSAGRCSTTVTPATKVCVRPAAGTEHTASPSCCRIRSSQTRAHRMRGGLAEGVARCDITRDRRQAP